MTGQIAYGVYLIPPPELAYSLGLGHVLLKNTFGMEAGSKFMPHCTLFAFLHLREGVGESELILRLEKVLAEHKAFPLEHTLGTEYFIRLDLAKHPGLMQLQANIRGELWDLLSQYGQNKRARPNFNPHMTLAFRDLPTEPGLLEQIHAYCRYLHQSMPQTDLKGKLVQLVEFRLPEGAEWDSDDYWRHLSWRIVKGYTLPD